MTELKLKYENRMKGRNDFFTLTDQDGIEYQWHGAGDKKSDPEPILLLIRKWEYPGAEYEVGAGESELEAIEAWIAAGHTNPEKIDNYSVVVSPAIYDYSNEWVDEWIDPETEEVHDSHIKTIKTLVQEEVVETRTSVIEPAKLIEKRPWVSSWPDSGLEDAINSCKSINDIKAVLLQLV